jgi:hypothetical protein
MMVCGRSTVDVDLLRANTTYEGYSSSDDTIDNFWRMMTERFNNRDRSAFLQFVWGRTRLPLSAQGFERRFRVQRLHHARPDEAFPVAHTCFFSVELPAYSGIEVMVERVAYAMRHCTSIDADAAMNAPDRLVGDLSSP